VAGKKLYKTFQLLFIELLSIVKRMEKTQGKMGKAKIEKNEQIYLVEGSR